MGAITPTAGANKEQIIADAEADGFRGRYLAWGAIHYWSLGMGMIGGALVITVFVSFVS